jgi:hypothetical protein
LSAAPAAIGAEHGGAGTGAPPRAPQPDSRARLGAWIRRRFLDPEPPLAAVEVRGRSLGIARFAIEQGRLALAVAASLDLPPGVLDISMARPNVNDAVAFRRALVVLLERGGVLYGGRVGLVLPDPVARVSVLPAAEVPGRGGGEELIRFRLRKAVPFEIRDARVASVPAGPDGSLVAVAVHRPVLDGYEDAFRAVGLEPGHVELAGLALWRALRPRTAGGDVVLVNWDEDYVTILLQQAGRLALARTLPGAAMAQPDSVAREVASTALYYRERLGGGGLSAAFVRSAAVPPAEAVRLLRAPLEVEPAVLDPWPGLDGAERDAAAQRLAGALCCVVGAAA